MSFDKNTWQTPKYVFNWLYNLFCWFHLDGCANARNTLCHRWIGKDSEICEDLSLVQSVWILLNPVEITKWHYFSHLIFKRSLVWCFIAYRQR
ncbi:MULTISPECIES: DNA N-6-adenine-methyltransferase [Glaesserella]|uniref:DNA N-6-adenine-methyltransferase n=1 Tax=Glaesserella TaxID=2094023 RepID=UPI000DBE4E92|nr:MULTISPECIES: DNA N-6-adenine-methyltransferase [Glaesserella]